MSTPIADLVEEMLARGVAPDLVVMAVRAAELASGKSGGIPVDTAAEKRRAYDRARKAEKRNSTGLSTGIPPDTENASLKKIESKKVIKRHGNRIPPDWEPSQADIEFALAKGMHRQRADTEAEKFRNYWTAKSGAAAAKLDWSATWRNWVLQSLERTPGDVAPASTGPPDWKRPPWEREGLSEAAWRSRELEKIRPTIRGNPGSSKNGADHAGELQLSGGMAHHDEAKAAGRASDHIPWDD